MNANFDGRCFPLWHQEEKTVSTVSRRQHKTVEAVSRSSPARFTGLKPGANETGRLSRVRTWSPVGAFFLPLVVHAHPGHDLFTRGVTHVAGSPDHLLLLMLAGLALFALSQMLRRARARRVTQSCAFVLLLIAVARMNFHG
jgi:hypothetical protein